jgi:hypothetical protein
LVEIFHESRGFVGNIKEKWRKFVQKAFLTGLNCLHLQMEGVKEINLPISLHLKMEAIETCNLMHFNKIFPLN